ncbi:hypothetical protein SGRIM128S_09667 [Streptomyces griseomycini]
MKFIVDPQGGLWVIDWELAMIGDPLYDLATHLHLMRLRRGADSDGGGAPVGAARPGAPTVREADLKTTRLQAQPVRSSPMSCMSVFLEDNGGR